MGQLETCYVSAFFRGLYLARVVLDHVDSSVSVRQVVVVVVVVVGGIDVWGVGIAG
jgi:catabolite regulation protein CreA